MSAHRPYQLQAIQRVHEELAVRRSTLLVMATGTGKTRTAVAVIEELLGPNMSALWLAHRDELIGQAEGRFIASGFRDVGREQGKLKAPCSRIVCASVQSLKGSRLAAMDRDRFDLIVVDEAHRAAAKGYRAVADHFASAKVLGLTATPDRLDGKPLGELFESVAFRYPIDRATREGYLCQVRARQVMVEGLTLDGVRRTRGDLNARDLAHLLNQEAHLHRVVDPLLELAGRRPTIVFAVDVAHGRALTEMINRYRQRAAALVTGKKKDNTDGRARADWYAAHERGEIQFLVNCEVLTEGWDGPYVSCVAIARPTASRALYAQMVGRGTRLHPGKADLLVLDFVGQAGKHRLVGPADALAGRIVSDEVRAAAARMREENPELAELDILELAIGWVERNRTWQIEREQLIAIAEFYTREVNPFTGKTLEPKGKGPPAWDSQIRQLKMFGLEKLPNGFTSKDADMVIGVIKSRKSAGLCSLKMARWLTRQGYAGAHEMTAEQAKRAYDSRMRKLKRFK